MDGACQVMMEWCIFSGGMVSFAGFGVVETVGSIELARLGTIPGVI